MGDHQLWMIENIIFTYDVSTIPFFFKYSTLYESVLLEHLFNLLSSLLVEENE